MKRFFDLSSSIFVLIFLSPVLLLIATLIVLETPGGIFFIQKRVGKNNKDFNLYKFRSMGVGSEAKGQLTVGEKDSRITKVGYFIRKYKLDEFPQLINVLKGEMSIVGPRPEVRKYIDLLDSRQKKILSVRPGLTDYASLEYINENKILESAEDPENAYIKQILPKKMELSLKYIEEQSLFVDVKVIFRTLASIFSSN